MKNASISRDTFFSLLSLAKSAQNAHEFRMQNASKHLEEFPNDPHWKYSVKFWQNEVKIAQDAYKKALEEVKYLD